MASAQNSREGGLRPPRSAFQVWAKMSLRTSMAISQRRPSQCLEISRSSAMSAARAAGSK